MLLPIMLVLAYGNLNWSFPWWVWCLAFVPAVTGLIREE